ncbi:TnsA-like heteromeric transposase endonuclease subunit [Kitasatospora phosalacinea]|uniref:TnsA-like heteromeric transposase endonuclease subunit n=1 Tax=Kitasatospora phosalacinea TaxID=2065 RepID=UPI003CC90F9D
MFLDPFGQAVQQRWADAALTVAFEDLDPVSAFPVPPGRRWGPGLWWSVTTGAHVVAGSNAMRAQLTVLDRDPRVSGLAGRPVRLLWRDRRGQVRSWVPQLFARYTDGTALLADCPSHAEAGGERALRAGAVVAAACEEVGWRYRRLLPLEPVLAGNLKWLAGYRHPRNHGRPGMMEAVLAAFARPRPLIEGVAAVGNPVEVMPVLFHALWRGYLRAPLDVALHERVQVGPGARVPGRCAADDGTPGQSRGRREARPGGAQADPLAGDPPGGGLNGADLAGPPAGGGRTGRGRGGAAGSGPSTGDGAGEALYGVERGEG